MEFAPKHLDIKGHIALLNLIETCSAYTLLTVLSGYLTNYNWIRYLNGFINVQNEVLLNIFRFQL